MMNGVVDSRWWIVWKEKDPMITQSMNALGNFKKTYEK